MLKDVKNVKRHHNLKKIHKTQNWQNTGIPNTLTNFEEITERQPKWKMGKIPEQALTEEPN